MTTPSEETTGIERSAVSGPEEPRCIYWHRDLPPVDAEMLGEHVLEANSSRVHASFAYRDEAWESCYRDLMEQTHTRLKQEIDRLGGHYAHIVDESVLSRRDDATGSAWLHGRFTYMLYRRTDALTIDRSGAP
jgi:hypothetical protein